MQLTEALHKRRQWWRLTRAEYRDAVLALDPLQIVNIPQWLDAHEKGIAAAVRQGKLKVPQRVLADYPDLA